MRYAFAIALALCATPTVLAQPFEAVVQLGTGSTHELTIDEVTHFGFYYDGGRGIFFRQIDSLYTQDSGLVREVTERVPEAEVTEADGTYTVRFQGIEFARHQRRAPAGVVREIHVMGGALGGERWGLDGSVRLTPTGLGPSYASLLSSIGWRPSTGTFKAGLGFGVGARFGADPLRLSVEAQVWQRFFQNDGERAEVSASALNSGFNALAVAAHVEWAASERTGIWAGVRFYPLDVDARYDEFSVVGLAGVRYTAFRRKPASAQ